MKKCRYCGYYINKKKLEKSIFDSPGIFDDIVEDIVVEAKGAREEVMYVRYLGEIFNNTTNIHEYVTNGICFTIYSNNSIRIKSVSYRHKRALDTYGNMINISREEYVGKLRDTLKSLEPEHMMYKIITRLLKDEEV